MQHRSSKVLALLGGVATLAVGSTFLLRASAPRPRFSPPCAPRLLELERAVCDAPLASPSSQLGHGAGTQYARVPEGYLAVGEAFAHH